MNKKHIVGMVVTLFVGGVIGYFIGKNAPMPATTPPATTPAK